MKGNFLQVFVHTFSYNADYNGELENSNTYIHTVGMYMYTYVNVYAGCLKEVLKNLRVHLVVAVIRQKCLNIPANDMMIRDR